MSKITFHLLALLLLVHAGPAQSQTVLQQIQRAVTPPDPRTVFQGGSPGSTQVQLPGGGACNIKLPDLPKAEDIAKAVMIPVDDIAKKAVELQTEPLKVLFKALGDELAKKISSKVDELRNRFWEKVDLMLYFGVVLLSLFGSLIVGFPTKALVSRIPAPKR